MTAPVKTAQTAMRTATALAIATASMRPCLRKSAHSGLQMPQRTRQMQSAELRSAAMSENTDYTKQERVKDYESTNPPDQRNADGY
jgi:hypothetical protein